MNRPVTLITICAVLVCGLTAVAEDDPVAKKLTAAKEEFEKTADKARSGLLADLKKRADAAQKGGDLKTLEKVRAEAKAFEDGGELPKSVPIKTYQSQMRTARAGLEESYAAAVKQYTMDGKIAVAKAVQQELDEFKVGPSRPADAVKFGGKFYKVFDTNLTWQEAKKRCEQMGGRLAVIDSAEENGFVAGLVKKSKVVEVWLGATDEKKEGEWVWVTGKKMTYSNWGPMQPNNKPPGEHYLVLVLVLNGQWSDQPDKSVQHKPGFVCQWD